MSNSKISSMQGLRRYNLKDVGVLEALFHEVLSLLYTAPLASIKPMV